MMISLVGSNLYADKIEDKILKFEKTRISKNKRIKLKDIKLFFKKDLNQGSWKGYVFDVTISVQKKEINIKDIIFSDGVMIAPELINIDTKQSFKKIMYPTLDVKYYNREYLIYGNKFSKHSITIFSDPLCPICVDVVPEIIDNIRKSKKDIAIYYIPMPLNMHPTAKLIVKAALLAQKAGIKDIDYKVYTAHFDNEFDAYEEKDEEKVLKIFNKKFKTNFTMKEINSERLNNKIKHSLKLSGDALVNGTPTIFFDGKIDQTREKYLRYLK
jgi:hypothetical protein